MRWYEEDGEEKEGAQAADTFAPVAVLTTMLSDALAEGRHFRWTWTEAGEFRLVLAPGGKRRPPAGTV